MEKEGPWEKARTEEEIMGYPCGRTCRPIAWRVENTIRAGIVAIGVPRGKAGKVLGRQRHFGGGAPRHTWQNPLRVRKARRFFNEGGEGRRGVARGRSRAVPRVGADCRRDVERTRRRAAPAKKGECACCLAHENAVLPSCTGPFRHRCRIVLDPDKPDKHRGRDCRETLPPALLANGLRWKVNRWRTRVRYSIAIAAASFFYPSSLPLLPSTRQNRR